MLPLCPADAVGCRDALTPLDVAFASPLFWAIAGIVVALVVSAIVLRVRRRR